jgi:putative hemolysin
MAKRPVLKPEQKFINVKEVIRKKNPNLVRAMPGFLLRIIKNIIHEDDINYVLHKNGHLYGVEFVDQYFEDIGLTYTCEGQENIPRDGRYIFISNHPLGGLDGMVLISCIGHMFNNRIKFIVNDILLNLKNLEPVFIPVNTLGKQSPDYARMIEDTYASDQQILTFPAGLCSRKIKGKIEDLQWKKNFISKAIHYQRDIIPIHFEGKNSNFFYNLANLRKKIGIKANIEMFFLPHEMFKQKDKQLHMTFGKPISWQTLDKRFPPRTWAQKLKEHVYSLKDDAHHSFDF